MRSRRQHRKHGLRQGGPLCRQDSMYIMSGVPRVRHLRGPATMALARFLRGTTPSVHRVLPSPSTSSREIERCVTGSSRAI